MCEPEDGEGCPTAKGAVRLTIELTGVMSYGAVPQHGRNPIPVAAQVVGALAEVERRLADEHPTHEHLGRPHVPITASPPLGAKGHTMRGRMTARRVRTGAGVCWKAANGGPNRTCHSARPADSRIRPDECAR